MAVMMALLLDACSPLSQEIPDAAFPDNGGGNPLVEIEGKVRFFLDVPGSSDIVGDTVLINTIPYEVRDDGKGHACVDAYVSNFGEYFAAWAPSAESEWHDEGLYSGLMVPHCQFHGRTDGLSELPLFARYEEAGGDLLKFRPVYSVLELAVTGEAGVASVHFSSSRPMAGRFSHKADFTADVAAEGVSFLTLNCMDEGSCVQLTSAGTVFRAAVIPGEYPDGMDVTVVSQDHKAGRIHVPGPLTLAPGDTLRKEMSFTTGDILFHEGFDTFVWGADVMGGEDAAAFSPSGETATLTGLEYALESAACTDPGSVYPMSESWIRNRGLSDWKSCELVCEYQGCVAVLTEDKKRGNLQTPALGGGFYGDITLEYDFCPIPGNSMPVAVSVLDGGTIVSVRLNGTELDLTSENFDYQAINGTLLHEVSTVVVPVSDKQKKQWNHVELAVRGASSSTSFRFAPAATSSARQGFYLDDVQAIRVLDRSTGNPDHLRLLYWNIQQGMACDQNTGYSNFISWVRSWSPDVCVWCEAFSNKGGSLPEGWSDVASSYGHENVAGTGSYHLGSGDKFPQEVTSVLPLEHVLNVPYETEDGMRITHGGGLVKTRFGSMTVGIVPAHLRPRAEMDNAAVDDIQLRELAHILKHTVLNPDFSDIDGWIVLGDFNSHSPADRWMYDLTGFSLVRYKAHEYLLANTDLIDAVRHASPGYFTTTMSGKNRIDFVYISPSLKDLMVTAEVLTDSWTLPVPPSEEGSVLYYPSDHRPIMIDFKTK